MRFALATTVLLVGFACSAVNAREAVARGGSGIVSRNGRIGRVHVETSTVADVRRYAGRPTTTSRSPGENGVPTLELRYGCGASRSSSYFFDRTGHLANFLTTCHRWQTANGTHIGDSQSTAEANERKRATIAGCGNGRTIERTGRATLFITFFASGGRARALAIAGHNSVLGC
jgi:hypothetical protein